MRFFLSKRRSTTWHRVVSVSIKDSNVKIALPVNVNLDTVRTHMGGALIDQMRRVVGQPIERGSRLKGKARTSAERVVDYRAKQAARHP